MATVRIEARDVETQQKIYGAVVRLNVSPNQPPLQPGCGGDAVFDIHGQWCLNNPVAREIAKTMIDTPWCRVTPERIELCRSYHAQIIAYEAILAGGYQATGYTDVDGEIIFTDVPAGSGEIRISHDYQGWSPQLETIYVVQPYNFHIAYINRDGEPPPPETYTSYIKVVDGSGPIPAEGPPITNAVMYLMHGIHGEYWGYADANGIVSFVDMPAWAGYDGWIEAPGFETKPVKNFDLAANTYERPYLIWLIPVEPPPEERGLHIELISPESIPNGIYGLGNPLEILVSIRNDTLDTKEVRVIMRSASGNVLDTEPDLYWKNISAGGVTTISVGISLGVYSISDEYIYIELWEQHDGKMDIKHVTVGNPAPPDGEGIGMLLLGAIGLGALYLISEMKK